ncbi:MFS transporter [Yokenella regensburgei]|jgi:MFS family permease|uniref:MFS transporter n=1 Tax=Yokenella regensburgei TaxID=158877 RepID=A0ABX9RXA1_9ENTR|nr:MFS transporter [Yokenella regensburgei]RKR54652.1 MFS transporter [Yokenella regensburgei]VFS25298.1 Major Facilitator Superfamily [Yokenella regensburgei]
MKKSVWLKKIGYLDSTFRAMQSTSNQISHLLVGALGGMFGSAVSLRVSIAFYSSILLEIPSGLLADRLGHFKSVSLGCLFTAIALIALYFSLASSSEVSLQITMLIFSSFISAIGMCLISGAYQAMLQDMIDFQIIKNNEASGMRTKALLLSQRYGKEIVSVVPILFLLILLIMYRTVGHAEIMLFIPAAMFICLSFWLWNYPERNEMHANITAETVTLVKSKNTLKNFTHHLKTMSREQLFVLLKLSLVIIFLNFSMVHVHTYLMVAEFREYNIMNIQVVYLIPLFIFIASFDAAHYVKGVIVPHVAARFSDRNMIIISFSSLSLLSALCYELYLHWNGIFALILYVLFFRAAVTIGQDVAISNLLARLPEEIRAFSLSLVMSTVIVLYGAYSIYLTFIGVGTEPAQNVLLEILFLALLGGGMALYIKITPLTEPQTSEIQQTN